MTWGKETPGSTDRFEAKLLPPGTPDPRESTLVGVSAGSPEVNAEHESGGGADVGASAGKATWRRRLAPRHREAVKSYFTQEKPK
jgi:hypothetical protein